MKFATVLLVAFLLMSAPAVFSQSAQDELAKDAANPVANLMSIPLQNNADYGIGPHNRSSNVFNFQPVIPLAQGKWITRTIFPFASVPDVSAETGTLSSGLSDILFTAFYVPGKSSFTWGAGPVLGFPTGGDIRGSEKWTAGLSGLVLAQPGPWTVGLLANNVWSYAGDSEAPEVNKGSLQYFVVYQLGNGWYLNSAPIIDVNWNASEGNKWKVPFGGGGGKVMFLGKLPVNIQTQAYYFVESPDNGPEWQWRFQFQFFLPLPGSG